MDTNQRRSYLCGNHLEKTGEERQVTLERIDPEINFNWVRNSPGHPISEDHFTVEWTGYIKPDHTTEYLFSAMADDGMRLFIDNQLVLDMWEPQEEGTDSQAMREDAEASLQGRIRLEKDRFYPIRIEYYETVQNARIHLYWESPQLEREVVAGKHLYTQTGLEQGNGLKGIYTSMRQYIAYTHNQGNLYATSFDWPGNELALPIERPRQGTSITLLGRDGELPWNYRDGQLIINTSVVKYNEMPSHYAWTFKIENYE